METEQNGRCFPHRLWARTHVVHGDGLYPEDLPSGWDNDNTVRQGLDGESRWHCGDSEERVSWEMGKVILELGLGREAENLFRGLFLQLGPTQLLKIPGPQLSLTGEQPRWGKPTKEARSREPSLAHSPARQAKAGLSGGCCCVLLTRAPRSLASALPPFFQASWESLG